MSTNLLRSLKLWANDQGELWKLKEKKKNSLLTGMLGVFNTGGAGRASDSGWFQCLALYTAFVGD